VNEIADFSSGAPFWLAPVLISPIVGSFLGVLIQRLPEARPIVFARSRCDRCGHPLAPVDLVPLVSYAVSRGRCRYCGESIGSFPLAIELAALAVAAWAAVTVEDSALWLTCVFGWMLLTAAWIDLRTMLLPDILTLPSLAIGLAATWLTMPDALVDHLLAAALGYLSLAALAWAWRTFRGRDGLGLGDAKLLAALGAWLGLSELPYVLLLAACAGLAAAGAAALAGKRVTAVTAVPFGPCLAIAGWLLWLYADSIADFPIDGWLGGWLAGG
jgi:leader peptidase (prepilin peptidase)/N-methyltransferase